MFELTPYGRRGRQMWNQMGRTLSDMNNMMNVGMSTDIIDRGDHFELNADLPGYDKDEIKIGLQGDRLVISAERKQENEKKDEDGKYIYRERSYGSYNRSFDVRGIDTKNITAGYKNGVLRLKLPKVKPEADDDSIEIEISD